MEVKPGYKQTEVGVIPEDWEVRALATSCDIITKGTTPTSIGRAFTDTGVKFLKAESISESGKTIPDKVAYIDDATHSLLKRSQLTHGDLLISIAGVLGRVGLVERTDLPANINQALAIIRLGKNTELVRDYLFYCLRSPVVSKQISYINVQAAQANISLQNVRDFLLPLPSTKAEQEAIAKVLNNADAFIKSLEQFLAKKRNLKQGAMQELLTGKIRLPGFSGKWEILEAGNIGRFRGGSGFPTKFQGIKSGRYPFFKVSDMNNEGNETFMTTANNYISEELRKQLGAIPFPPGSIAFAKVGAAVFLERKKILATISCMDNNMAAFVLENNLVDCRYIHYVMLSIKLGDLACSTALPSLSGNTLSQIKFPLPPRQEQTAIASILSDMDTEIALLEEKLAKTRHLKQGMMQELLTGRIRLV